MLIDRHLPRFQFTEHHAREIAGSPQDVLAAAIAWTRPPSRDPVYRALAGLRQLPARALNRLKPAPATQPAPLVTFLELEIAPAREVVFGAAGRFWKLQDGIEPLADAAAFAAYEAPGAARLAMNFAVTALGDGRTRLSTETRIFCHDTAAIRRFRPYWILIRAASGLIRHRALAAIDRQVQAGKAQG